MRGQRLRSEPRTNPVHQPAQQWTANRRPHIEDASIPCYADEGSNDDEAITTMTRPMASNAPLLPASECRPGRRVPRTFYPSRSSLLLVAIRLHALSTPFPSYLLVIQSPPLYHFVRERCFSSPPLHVHFFTLPRTLSCHFPSPFPSSYTTIRRTALARVQLWTKCRSISGSWTTARVDVPGPRPRAALVCCRVPPPGFASCCGIGSTVAPPPPHSHTTDLFHARMSFEGTCLRGFLSICLSAEPRGKSHVAGNGAVATRRRQASRPRSTPAWLVRPSPHPTAPTSSAHYKVARRRFGGHFDVLTSARLADDPAARTPSKKGNFSWVTSSRLYSTTMPTTTRKLLWLLVGYGPHRRRHRRPVYSSSPRWLRHRRRMCMVEAGWGGRVGAECGGYALPCSLSLPTYDNPEKRSPSAATGMLRQLGNAESRGAGAVSGVSTTSAVRRLVLRPLSALPFLYIRSLPSFPDPLDICIRPPPHPSRASLVSRFRCPFRITPPTLSRTISALSLISPSPCPFPTYNTTADGAEWRRSPSEVMNQRTE
uniref:Uncharacterized protein n=1 Tax=Mycena chlorophos TaxID=658473 RepID=A0ABQ0M3G6_MYCCL|nr:predicted protein [Mycena chlorophos]